MVEMAEGLVSDLDVAYLLTGLAGYSVELLGVTASGVMLASPDGELRIMASSSESMHVLELFELQSNEGPCLDAYRTGETIENHRLDVSGDRWPEYSKAAIRAGFNSVMAVPMRLREATIGSLDLFGRDEITLSVADMHIAQAFANMAAVTILQYRAIAQSNLVNQQLTYALNSRIVIEQAKGIVAERAKVDLESAFYLLRRYARSHSLKLVDVARAATEGRIDIANLLAQNRPGRP
jgi:transcriptional regulator with GAF, ATPase, and Fis domain